MFFTYSTHLAAGIAIEAVNMGDTVAFITAPSLKIGDFKTVCEKVQECSGVDLLVIDDLSNETENKMTTDKIFELINHRYEQGAGTIITSNLNLTDFDSTVGARIFSRLGERTAIMRLEGVGSYREKKRERYVAWTKQPLEDQGPAER
ncbi:ATP-binding protein [Mesotoga prima]|uniref:ATP-binding protein n=1 Tax=Mesotoga prima TaxID=1184387 RepID=UPI0022A8D884|nr:ATP-binding protein [Mesotoga prima]